MCLLKISSLSHHHIASQYQVNASRNTRAASSSFQSHHTKAAPGCAVLWNDDDICTYQREGEGGDGGSGQHPYTWQSESQADILTTVYYMKE